MILLGSCDLLNLIRKNNCNDLDATIKEYNLKISKRFCVFESLFIVDLHLEINN